MTRKKRTIKIHGKKAVVQQFKAYLKSLKKEDPVFRKLLKKATAGGVSFRLEKKPIDDALAFYSVSDHSVRILESLIDKAKSKYNNVPAISEALQITLRHELAHAIQSKLWKNKQPFEFLMYAKKPLQFLVSLYEMRQCLIDNNYSTINNDAILRAIMEISSKDPQPLAQYFLRGLASECDFAESSLAELTFFPANHLGVYAYITGFESLPKHNRLCLIKHSFDPITAAAETQTMRSSPGNLLYQNPDNLARFTQSINPAMVKAFKKLPVSSRRLLERLFAEVFFFNTYVTAKKNPLPFLQSCLRNLTQLQKDEECMSRLTPYINADTTNWGYLELLEQCRTPISIDCIIPLIESVPIQYQYSPSLTGLNIITIAEICGAPKNKTQSLPATQPKSFHRDHKHTVNRANKTPEVITHLATVATGAAILETIATTGEVIARAGFHCSKERSREVYTAIETTASVLMLLSQGIQAANALLPFFAQKFTHTALTLCGIKKEQANFVASAVSDGVMCCQLSVNPAAFFSSAAHLLTRKATRKASWSLAKWLIPGV